MSRTYRITFLLSLFACVSFAQKGFQDGQAARAVVGQFTFSKGDQNPTGQVLGGAGGVAWAANRLFVADSNRIGATPNDDRVLIFDTTVIPTAYTDLRPDAPQPFSPIQTLTSCYVCGTPAIVSLGQNSFTAPTYVPSGQVTPTTGFYNGVNGTDQYASTPVENAWLYNATAVASDGVRFAIADTDNNRILLWNSIPTANVHPDLVLGQPDFNTVQTQQLGVVTATGLRGPQGVWIANNKLYVADTQNSRVLIWNSWPTKNNQSPDVVLGQNDFVHATAPAPSTTAPTAAANQLFDPVSVTADSAHVYVSDLGFNRVLIWNTTSPSMDQPADVVIGQPDFTQTTANNTNVCTNYTTLATGGPCQTSLNFPRFALSDGTRLFVADSGNDRVLIFNTIPTQSAPAASHVLGQTNFINDIVTSTAISIVSTQVDNTGGTDTTRNPTSLAWDGTNLYVADPLNRRVLIFTEGDTQLPSPFNSTATVIPVVNWASEIVRQEGFVTFSAGTGKVTAGDTATITIAGTAYQYIEKTNDSFDTIAKNLISKINASDTNVTALFGGVGTGTVYLSSIDRSGAEVTSLQYDSISLAASVSNTANVTVSTSGSYLSAGNAATASPGMLIEVNAPSGVSLTDTDSAYVFPFDGSAAPNSVNGVQLYIDGFASPLYKVTPTQLVGQIPYFYGDRNSSSIYVRTVHNNGTVTVTTATPVYIAPANPGIFNKQQYPGQTRPWPISQAYHQLNNPSVSISIDGSATANDVLSVWVNGTEYDYTVTSTDTLKTIVAALVTAMQNDPLVTPSPGGLYTRLVLTAKQNGFSGGNGIPISVGVGKISSGTNTNLTCPYVAQSGTTETMTLYGAGSSVDSCNRSTFSTCCAVQNGSPIFPGNPAVPGELISISVAGMGDIADTNGNDITTSITTGQPYTGVDLPNNDVLAANFAAATLGSTSAQVITEGLQKGSYGIYRVDVWIPTGLSSNPQTPFHIAQNAFISNTVLLPIGSAVANPPSPPASVPISPINTSIDSPITAAIDSATSVSGSTPIIGWAIDSVASVTNVALLIDGSTVANFNTANGYYGVSRPDVCQTYPTVKNCPNVGFSYMLDTTQLANGGHTLQILVTDANGNNHTNPQGVAIFVNNDPTQSPTQVSIDVPVTTGQIYHGVTMFSGWATNSSSPIVSFKASMDGTPVDASQITYGISRPDVCAVANAKNINPPGCPNVGWQYLADLTKLANSNATTGATGGAFLHTFTLTATAANGQSFTVSSQFNVNNYDPYDLFSGPAIDIDSPSATAGTLSGSVQLWGWALDAYTTIGAIQYSVDGVILGNLQYGIGRPDVCTAYAGLPNFNLNACPYVGYSGTLDTTLLSDGQHTLGITATPTQGQPYTLTRTITVHNLDSTSNPVRIAIDSPVQITSTPSTLSGIATISGWSITDSPSTEAISSVEVLVDGVVKGSASYGVSRADVCTIWGSRPGCPAVGFTYALDTTSLTNGTHSLEITSSTATGKRATNSAIFNVSNTSSSARTYIDTPNGESIPVSGILRTFGWAIKDNVAINRIGVTVDGISVGNATYGVARPDVCAAYPGHPGCPNVGWSFLYDTNALIDGQHTLGITAFAADGTANTTSTTFTVQNWSSGAPMNYSIDTPVAAEPYYTGTNTFAGWFVVPNASVATVSIVIDGIPFGNAARVSRPDVCSAYPTSPDCPNTGWSFTLNTSLLTNDVHTLAITATTTGGQSFTVTQTFISEN